MSNKSRIRIGHNHSGRLWKCQILFMITWSKTDDTLIYSWYKGVLKHKKKLQNWSIRAIWLLVQALPTPNLTRNKNQQKEDTQLLLSKSFKHIETCLIIYKKNWHHTIKSLYSDATELSVIHKFIIYFCFN